MTRIGLLFAVKCEVPDKVYDMVSSVESGRIGTGKAGNHDLGAILSGIGREGATAAAGRLCTDFRPDYLITLGICGGVGKRHTIGELLVANAVHYHGHEMPLKSEYLDDAIRRLSTAQLPYLVGKFQAFDSLVTSRKGVLPDAVGVDMESYAIAAEAHRRGLHAVIVKSVSDIVPEEAHLFAEARALAAIALNFRTAKKSLNEFARFYFAQG